MSEIVSPGRAGLAGVTGAPAVEAQHVELVYAVRISEDPVLLLLLEPAVTVVDMEMPSPAGPACFAVSTTRANWPPALAVTLGSLPLLMAAIKLSRTLVSESDDCTV